VYCYIYIFDLIALASLVVFHYVEVIGWCCHSVALSLLRRLAYLFFANGESGVYCADRVGVWYLLKYRVLV